MTLVMNWNQVLESYQLERMVLHDVAVMDDSHRMLCVGGLLASADGMQPKKSRAEKQILGIVSTITRMYISY